MIPQRNTIEKIHTKVLWCGTPEGQEGVEIWQL